MIAKTLRELDGTALIECENCGNPCRPHVLQEIDGVRKRVVFCSDACRQEWVQANTATVRVGLPQATFCYTCGGDIHKLDYAYMVKWCPFKKPMGKHYCSPDCAHEHVDVCASNRSKIIKENILPITAGDFVTLVTGDRFNLGALNLLAMFENRPIMWYSAQPHFGDGRFLTAPAHVYKGSPIREYLHLFEIFVKKTTGKSLREL